jgi:hypothetical protein
MLSASDVPHGVADPKLKIILDLHIRTMASFLPNHNPSNEDYDWFPVAM